MATAPVEELDKIVREYRNQLPEPLNKNENLTFSDTKQLFERECAFWRENKISELLQQFQNVLNALTASERNFEPNDARRRVSEALTQARGRIILSTTTEARFLVELRLKNQAAVPKALAYLNGTLSQSERLSHPHEYDGVIAASLFKNQDFIVNAGLEARTKAFDDQQTQVEAFCHDIGNHYERSKAEADTWQTTTQQTLEKLVENGQQSFRECSDQWTDAFKQSHEAWKVEQDNLKKELADLKKTYNEQHSRPRQQLL